MTPQMGVTLPCAEIGEADGWDSFFIGGLLAGGEMDWSAADGVVGEIEMCIDDDHSSRKASKMPHDAAAEGAEMIAAFEGADDPAAGNELWPTATSMRVIVSNPRSLSSILARGSSADGHRSRRRSAGFRV